MTRYIASSALGLVLLAAPASAHHAAAVAYHVDQTITVEGVVTEVKWENPHTWVYVEAKDASGLTSASSWRCSATAGSRRSRTNSTTRDE